MEYKWKAVIQHFRFLVPALAQPTVRPSRIKTFEYDLVIKFGGDFALFGQDQPGFFGDQSNVYGVAGKAARQVEIKLARPPTAIMSKAEGCSGAGSSSPTSMPSACISCRHLRYSASSPWLSRRCRLGMVSSKNVQKVQKVQKSFFRNHLHGLTIGAARHFGKLQTELRGQLVNPAPYFTGEPHDLEFTVILAIEA